MNFFRLLIDFLSISSSSWRGRGFRNTIKINGFWRFCVFCLMLCWNQICLIIFLSIFGPTWAPKSIHNRSKFNQKVDKKMIDFLIDVGSIFSRFLVPSWSQVGAKLDQKSIKNGPKINQKWSPRSDWKQDPQNDSIF